MSVLLPLSIPLSQQVLCVRACVRACVSVSVCARAFLLRTRMIKRENKYLSVLSLLLMEKRNADTKYMYP
jgi:hypothetical protein